MSKGKPVVHFELMAKDPAKLSAFYEKLFDWKVQLFPEMNYRIVEAGEGGIGGGIFKPEQQGAPGGTTLYIAVDDLAAYRKRITEAGGTICVEEQEVPGMGWFTLFTDPDGRLMGLWKSAPQK
ncbi:MAG TPA: VOC family protein [Burkholderiaceae bacterium]|nr:VOC family protein [Burkholderiaceae bacterium]